MNSGKFEIVIRRDTRSPQGVHALKRIRVIVDQFPNPVPDRLNCFLRGLTKGWVLSQTIGLADADDVDELLPERPLDVFDAIPYGPQDANDPEFSSLSADEIPDDVWFSYWMGIKKSLYLFNQRGITMPDLSVFAWLGFLRGEFEGGGISLADYDKLRALLPQVQDDLTPLAVATQ